MTREEKLQKAHQMFDNRNLLTELKWQREFFKKGYISSREELFNLWIFDECIKTIEQEPVLDKIKADVINIADGKQSIKVRSVLRIIDKYKAENGG